MSPRRFQFRPQLEAFEDRLCPSSTVVLPISAFLSQQGTTMMFTGPVRDQLGWSNSVFDPGTTSTDPNRFLLADYTGQAAQYLLQHGIDLYTKVSGLVTETPVGTSGLMEVSVDLEATNALTWVADVEGLNINVPPGADTAPLELGYRAEDLVANPHLKPALSDVHFQFNFQEQVGAPLPDLVQALTLGNAPPGFAPEVVNFQSWGAGTLNFATTVGTPGQAAFVRTSQVGYFTPPNSNLPGTLPDGFFQEPIDLVPVASTSSTIAYLNGTLFVTDLSNNNDSVTVTPAAGGGVTVSSNLGGGTFDNVSTVVVSLGGGNNRVSIASLPGVSVQVNALDGNNRIAIGDKATALVSVGAGNNDISIGNAGPAQVFVAGSGNNHISTGSGINVLYVAGNGNNHISAAGTNDFIEVLGNGNNHIADTGSNDLVWLGGDGNNHIDNQGVGSFTHILAGTGHNRILGPWDFGL
jgi:hypothetical protein